MSIADQSKNEKQKIELQAVHMAGHSMYINVKRLKQNNSKCKKNWGEKGMNRQTGKVSISC
jgi:hypothetical protein